MKKLNEGQFRKANSVIIYYFCPFDETSVAYHHHHTVSEKNYNKIVLHFNVINKPHTVFISISYGLKSIGYILPNIKFYPY